MVEPRNILRAVCALVALLAAGFAAASPASATLVYEQDSADGSAPAIWAAADDGTAPVQLGFGDVPLLSADGKWVAFLSGIADSAEETDLLLLPVAGGEPARVVAHNVDDPSGVAWSPDSHTIAVAAGLPGRSHRLLLVDVAAGTSREVARGYFYGVSFSPDGTSLVYGRAAKSRYPASSEIYSAPVAGGTPAPLTSGGRSLYPLWGPRVIAFVRQRRGSRSDGPKFNLYAIGPRGGQPRRLTNLHPPFLLSGLTPTAWSQDGTRLLAEYGGQDTSEAWTVDPASGRGHDLTGRFDGVIGYGLSRDGAAVLATTGGFDPEGEQDVVEIPYGGGKPTVLVQNAYNPTWNR